jgi:hypothetical protein
MLNPTEMPLSAMASRLLTEAECKAIAQDNTAVIVEWQTNGLSFIASAKYLGIMRTGALGGDMRDIHGGWKYDLPSAFNKELAEIKRVAPAFQTEKRSIWD